jgi:predicted NUDIX family phosphoesterase
VDPAKAAESVLVIPMRRLAVAGRFQGFRAYDPRLFRELLDPAHFEFRPRGEVEGDPSFKQLIPYVVLRCGDDLFRYSRGAGGAEARLRSLESVGIGGHISADDALDRSGDVYRTGMMRELVEEVAIRGPFTERCLGFINDDSTPVGQVHLGVAHVFELSRPDVLPRETALANAGFAPLAELLGRRELFESWSRLVMEALAAGH